MDELSHDLLDHEEKYLLNRTVTENVVFTNDNYKLKFLRIDTSEFKGNLTFKDTDLKCGIYFYKCTFYEDLKFEGITIEQFGNILHEPYESIIFEECIFYGKVIFSHSSTILRNVVFKKQCTLYKSFEFINSFITEGSLNIEDCTFKDIIDVQRSSFGSQLSISGTKVDSSIRIISINANSISFIGSNDFQRGRIETCQFENGIIFNDGIFNADWEINACGTRKHGLTLFSSQFKTSLIVNYQLSKVYTWRLGDFYIRDSVFGNGMYVHGRKEELTPEKSLVDSIDIKFSTSMKGEISFQDLDVGNIKLSGANTGCNVVFRNIEVNQLEIDTLTNSSGLIFSYISKSSTTWQDVKDNSKLVESLFKIDDSNLGKAQMHAIDFTGFKEVIISGSLISEISVSLIEWFKICKLNKSSLESIKRLYGKSLEGNDEELTANKRLHFQKTLENKKDILRQLKIIYQNSRITQMHFIFKSMK